LYTLLGISLVEEKDEGDKSSGINSELDKGESDQRKIIFQIQ
jgi:hypothetical protein